MYRSRLRERMASRTQDLLFTLYGDYIRHRGGEAWTGSLIELMGCLGISPQAVRSTLSRMSRKGWLAGRRVGRYSFYRLTPKSVKLLTEGAQRIFNPRSEPWDGRWHILAYSIPERQRHLRHRLREQLMWLGYGQLGHGVLIFPRDLGSEVEEVLDTLNVRQYVDIFTAEHEGFTSNEDIIARCWNLDGLNACYAEFIATYRPGLERYMSLVAEGQDPDACECFVQRFMLVHEYRTFPYVDPNLPAELLPPDWLGGEATWVFTKCYELLADGANSYVDAAMARAPAG